MIVSMIQLIIEIPEAGTLKDKRSIVKSVTRKLQNRFRLSAAEVDLQDSRSFAQLGAVIVSNSRVFGESVLNKAPEMIENEMALAIQDVSIHTEDF